MVVTWDSINKGTAVTLSNNDLTAMVSNYSSTARATVGKSVGKWYWEVSVDVFTNAVIGIVNSTAGINRTNNSTNAMYYNNLGTKWNGSSGTAYGNSYENNVISVLLDLDNGTIEFWKEGVSQGIAFTTVSSLGEVFPSVSSGSSSVGSTFTANFGASNFKYPIPNGYRSYDDSQSSLNKVIMKSNNKYYSTISNKVSYQPNMTSNTLPIPYMAEGNMRRSTTYDYWKVFNGTNRSETDSWQSSTSTGDKWIQLNLGTPKVVNELYLTSINHTSTIRSPRDFSILGSNDGINFKELYVTKNIITSWDIDETKYFKFNNDEKFLIYRILITRTLEDLDNYDVRIGKIEFGYDSEGLLQIPSYSEETIIKYGASNYLKFRDFNNVKHYLLQDTISENEQGLWTTTLSKKPLSIKFTQ